MELRMPRSNKLVTSAAICAGAVGFLLALKYLFPGFNWVQYESTILTAVIAWVINTLKESTK